MPNGSSSNKNIPTSSESSSEDGYRDKNHAKDCRNYNDEKSSNESMRSRSLEREEVVENDQSIKINFGKEKNLEPVNKTKADYSLT